MTITKEYLIRNKIRKVLGGTIERIYIYSDNKFGLIIKTKDEKVIQLFIDNPEDILVLEQEIIKTGEEEDEFFMNIQKAE